MKHQTEAVEPPYPTQPQSVTEPRRCITPCLPGAFEQPRLAAHAREAEDLGGGEAVIGRLSERFKNLTTEEQMQAILSAKRKQATSVEGETANEQQEEGEDVATAEQSVSQMAT